VALDPYQGCPRGPWLGFGETYDRKEIRAMSNTPHELHEEFPEHAAAISELKQSNAHFAKLAEEYHEVNRAVHRAETNVEPIEQLAENDLRKRRSALKDELYSMIKETA
jgi:uncharacterized protein YdcH (DUF465 family)